MKVFLSIIIGAMCYACFPSREIQAEIVYATLVKVEEVSRYPNNRQKLLTWETDRAISFVTYEPVSLSLPVGTKTMVLLQR